MLTRILHLTILLIFFVLICFVAVGKTVAKADGVDLFIKALEYQGDNPSLIHSIYVEYMLTERRPTKSKEFLDKERQQLIEDAQIGIPESIREQYIAYIPTRLKEKYGGERKSKGSYLLKGNRNSKDSKIRFVLSQFQSASADWGQPTIAVRGVINGKAQDSILGESDIKTVIVSSSSFYSEDFQDFGRIRGLPSVLVTASFIGSSAPERFVFSEKSVLDFRSNCKKLNSQNGNSILEIMKTTQYDDSAEAVVLETKMNNKLVQRYWIDQSRGYVCPFIQIYDPKTGNLVEEYKSSNYFIHEETGLWFPQKYEVAEYDTSGQLKLSREYEIDKATLKINHQVSDEEFAIDVQESYKVMDSRSKKNIAYNAVEKGVLTLGELNLDKMSWLERDKIVGEEQISEQNRSAIIVRSILIISGIVLMLWALWRSKRNRRSNCFIPFILMVICSG
jgi:hypothetical protein